MEQAKSVIALGFFDGVHRGHGALLHRVAARARELGVVPAAITFDVAPKEVALRRDTPLLTTVEERDDLMRRLYGIEKLIVIRFDSDFVHMGWQEFVSDFLIEHHGAVHLVAGHDFRFGYKGEGNALRLQEQCAWSGIGCDIISPVNLDNIVVSSTYIRALVAQGEMEQAMKYLGHPYTVIARLSRAVTRGVHSDFSAMSVTLSPGRALPPPGVYATRVWVDENVYFAATNIETQPKISDGRLVQAESFMLNFGKDFHGKTVRIEFCRRISPDRKLESWKDLSVQGFWDQNIVKTGCTQS